MTPVREPNLPWREVGGRAIILSPKHGSIHELNDVGTLLWTHADGETSIESLAETLAASFDIEPATAEADARVFFAELETLGLVRLH